MELQSFDEFLAARGVAHSPRGTGSGQVPSMPRSPSADDSRWGQPCARDAQLHARCSSSNLSSHSPSCARLAASSPATAAIASAA